MSFQEDLVLSEENGKIIIPAPFASKLVSVQRNGIRFIFKQFITKQPGVIHNDPSGYGKRVQVILFLEAIKTLLSESVLIVCHNVEKWRQELHAWIGNIDEVIVNPSSHTNKQKKYYITAFDNVKQHTSSKWSVIVIDCQNQDFMNGYSKVVKGLKGLKGQFVVWISSHDMLIKHLQIVSSILEWMDKDFKSKFEPILSRIWRCKCKVTKAIQLERAFQDLYLRRDGLENKFLSDKIEHIEEKPNKHKITKKNKDSTGTKIKRTKRTITEDDVQNSTFPRDEIVGNNILLTHDKKSTLSDEKSSQNYKLSRLSLKRKITNRIISSDDDEIVENNHNYINHELNEIIDDNMLKNNGETMTEIDKNKLHANESQNEIEHKSYKSTQIFIKDVTDNDVVTNIIKSDVDINVFKTINCKQNNKATLSKNADSSPDKSIIESANPIKNKNIIKANEIKEITSNNIEEIKCNLENEMNKSEIISHHSVRDENNKIGDKILVVKNNDKIKDKMHSDEELDELEKSIYKKYKGSLLDLL